MGMGITWDKEKFEQEEEVKRQLEKIRDGLCEQISNELDAILESIKADAISLCPVDTGALRSSISTEGGATGSSSTFYEASIYAGDPSIINPKSGKSTAEYAELVESGHALRDGTFWEGSEFLSQAMMMHEAELEEAVNRALAELGTGD